MVYDGQVADTIHEASMTALDLFTPDAPKTTR